MAIKKYKILARTSLGEIGEVKMLDEESVKAYWEEYIVETKEVLTSWEEENEDKGIESLTVKQLKILAEEKWIEIPKEIDNKEKLVWFLKIEIEKLEEKSGEDENK